MFFTRLAPGRFVLGREDDVICQKTNVAKPSLCNAFIMSEKGAAFGRLWLEEIEKVFDGSWSTHSTLLPQALSERYPDLIHIEPSRTFYNYMRTREGLHALLEGCDRNDSGVVSIHLWSHLWWSKKRRDFSDFHAGRITERELRQRDTTYNLIARRFLPSTPESLVRKCYESLRTVKRRIANKILKMPG
jgi:hypothetical protein